MLVTCVVEEVKSAQCAERDWIIMDTRLVVIRKQYERGITTFAECFRIFEVGCYQLKNKGLISEEEFKASLKENRTWLLGQVSNPVITGLKPLHMWDEGSGVHDALLLAYAQSCRNIFEMPISNDQKENLKNGAAYSIMAAYKILQQDKEKAKAFSYVLDGITLGHGFDGLTIKEVM